MAIFLDNLGLDFIRESEDTVAGLIGHVVDGGKAIVGYYGFPYFNRHYGSVQIIARTVRDDANKAFRVSGIDTHVSGNCIWTVRLSGIDINRKDADCLERRVIVTRPDGSGGMAVVNLVNADVLPSFAEEEIVKMQMAAFPTLVQYYADETAYEDAQPRSQSGKLFLLAPGTVFPTGFLTNRDPDSEHFNKNEYDDDLVVVRGTVKTLYKGAFEMEGEKTDTYIRCVIDTEFGELELDHTYDQVPEDMRQNIRVGATVNCVCVLSGNVAICEYENGPVLDEKHDLMALRHAFSGGDPQRILSIFAPDAKIRADGRSSEGNIGMILTFFQNLIGSVNSKNGTISTCMAQVASVRESAAAKYSPGKRCLAVFIRDPDPSTGYIFIDVDPEGKITEFYIDLGRSYQFKLDREPPENSPPEDIKVPESVVEPIFNRAQFHGFLDPELTLEEVNKTLEKPFNYTDPAVKVLAAKPRDILSHEKQYLANLFGYVFAKSAEMEYAETHRRGLFKVRPSVTLNPDDAWNGRYSTVFGTEIRKELENIMKIGKQFQKDYTFYRERKGLEAHGDDADLRKALQTVFLFGTLYAKEHMK